MIALIDYGAGNLTSVRKALAALGADVVIPQAPEDLRTARGIIVPGVGHFAATAALAGAWSMAIRQAGARGTPLLGICLGMQWLFDGSREAPAVPGLGALGGHCERLPNEGVKVPHVGWNSLHFAGDAALFAGIADGAQVYFTHSYVAPTTAATSATTSHGKSTFAAAVARDRIAGVQFHPEKSGAVGLQILGNWLDAL